MPDILSQLQQLIAGPATPDPRLDALRQMSEEANRMPVIDPNQLMRQRQTPPQLPPEYQPERRPYIGPEIPMDQFPPDQGDPNEIARLKAHRLAERERINEQGRTNRTTEQDLQEVYDTIDEDATDYAAVPEDPAEWPDTAEEFEKMYGRAPATDSEMEFYFGPDDNTK